MESIINIAINMIGYLAVILSFEFLKKILSEKAFTRVCLIGLTFTALSIAVSI